MSGEENLIQKVNELNTAVLQINQQAFNNNGITTQNINVNETDANTEKLRTLEPPYIIVAI